MDNKGSATTVAERIDALTARARREREAVAVDSEAVPAEERAMEYLRNGFGPTVWCYVDARTGSKEPLSESQMTLLDRGTNDWLTVYARCYGTEIDLSVSVRLAAEVLIETRNVRDTAQLLTDVPPR
jgi:sulfur carrier protein ThiS